MHPALKRYLGNALVLSAEQERLLSASFQPVVAGRGDIMVDRGAVADHSYLVVSGCLRVYLKDDKNGESTYCLLFEGDTGTSFSSFIQRSPSELVVQAIEPCHLLALSYPDRQQLFDVIPGWADFVRRETERNYMESIQRINKLISLNARGRYRDLLTNYPKIVLRVPSRIVAEYIGIAQETLSRLKSHA